MAVYSAEHWAASTDEQMAALTAVLMVDCSAALKVWKLVVDLVVMKVVLKDGCWAVYSAEHWAASMDEQTAALLVVRMAWSSVALTAC